MASDPARDYRYVLNPKPHSDPGVPQTTYTAEELVDHLLTDENARYLTEIGEGEFRIGEPDSMWMAYLYLEPTEMSGESTPRFVLEHMKHDLKWAETLNRMYNEHSTTGVKLQIWERPEEFLARPKETRWDDFLEEQNRQIERVEAVINERDELSNSRMMPIAQLLDSRGWSGMDTFIESGVERAGQDEIAAVKEMFMADPAELESTLMEMVEEDDLYWEDSSIQENATPDGQPLKGGITEELETLAQDVSNAGPSDDALLESLKSRRDDMLARLYSMPINQVTERMEDLADEVRGGITSLVMQQQSPSLYAPTTVTSVTPDQRLERIMNRLATGGSVTVGTNLKQWTYTPDVVKKNAMAGVETFKIMDDGALGVIEGQSGGVPRYSAITTSAGDMVANLGYSGGSDTLPAWGGEALLQTLMPEEPKDEPPTYEPGDYPPIPEFDHSADRLYQIQDGPWGQQFDDYTVEELANYMTSRAGDPDATNLSFIIGQPDTAWQMDAELWWNEEDGQYEYQLFHRRHDDHWEDDLIAFADRSSHDYFVNEVKDNAALFESIPEDERWDSLITDMYASQDAYMEAFENRDSQANNRMHEVSEALSGLDVVNPDEGHVVEINDFIQAESEGFPYAEFASGQLTPSTLQKILEESLKVSRQTTGRDIGAETRAMEEAQFRTRVEARESLRQSGVEESRLPYPEVATAGVSTQERRPRPEVDVSPPEERLFTIEGTGESPTHTFTAEQIADIIALTPKDSTQTDDYRLASFEVGTQGSEWKTKVSLTYDPYTGLYQYQLSPVEPDNYRFLEFHQKQASPEYLIGMVERTPLGMQAVADDRRYQALMEFAEKAKQEYMDVAAPDPMRLMELGEALNDVEGVQPRDDLAQTVRDIVERAREYNSRGVEFAADDLTWEDLDMALGKSLGQTTSFAPSVEQRSQESIEERPATVPQQQFRPVQLGFFQPTPASADVSYAVAERERGSGFGRQRRRSI